MGNERGRGIRRALVGGRKEGNAGEVKEVCKCGSSSVTGTGGKYIKCIRPCCHAKAK